MKQHIHCREKVRTVRLLMAMGSIVRAFANLQGPERWLSGYEH